MRVRKMVKKVHDKRPFYDRRIEPVVDLEWDKAENADEPRLYYWVEMFNGGWCAREYKPAVAKLYSERTGLKVILI